MWDQSPLKYADRCKTPTLFLHSDEDYRCWQAEALQMFTALKMHGVDSKLCMFKGENHELSRSGKPKHRIRRLKEMKEWFAHYLK
ncbi:Prolyl oligopeptidase family protein [compost metagenome]